MKFSELFTITRGESEGWFDPILDFDTQLFIDPFLVYASEQNEFAGSHQEVIDFFNIIFSFIAQSNGNKHHPYWKKAQGLLIFPEVEELCLGYTRGGTKGSGSSSGFSKLIAEAIWESIQAGLKEITHFEEISLLREGIGADRISDITANILKHRFIKYTRHICEKYSVPLQQLRVQGKFNQDQQVWVPIIDQLPSNPYNNKPILLSPSIYLRDLPTINPDSFWNYCRSNENELLRNDFGLDIQSKVNKKNIIEFARKHTECRTRFVKTIENEIPDPYDMAEDRKGLVNWHDATQEYVDNHKIIKNINSNEDFKAILEEMLNQFRKYVEDNRGWEMLWNDDQTPKTEHAAQNLLLGIIMHYCKANNIDISRETNIGRGPVDFKISYGYSLRSLLELKLAKNSKFWNGLEKQLPKYLEAEEVKIGYFLIVIYSEKELKKLRDLQNKISQLNKSLRYEIKAIIIDARANPPSASKL